VSNWEAWGRLFVREFNNGLYYGSFIIKFDFFYLNWKILIYEQEIC